MTTNTNNQIRQAVRKAVPAAAVILSVFTAQAQPNHGGRPSQPAAVNHSAPSRPSMPANRSSFANRSTPSAASYANRSFANRATPAANSTSANRPSFGGNRGNNASSFRQTSYRPTSPTSTTGTSGTTTKKGPSTGTNTGGSNTPGTGTPGTGTQSGSNNVNINKNTNINTNTNINRNGSSNGFGGGRGAGSGFNGGNRTGRSGSGNPNGNGTPGYSANNTNTNTNTNINKNTNININKNVNIDRGRGRVGGGRIPDDSFRSHFGRGHEFHVDRTVYAGGGHARFHFGGVSFGLLAPWPAAWLTSDAVYVDYADGGYYLCNRMHPGYRVPVDVTDCDQCSAQAPPSDCPNCTADAGQSDSTGAPTLYAGETIDQVVAALGTPQDVVDLGAKKIYVFANMKITFVGGRMVDAR